MRNGWPIKEAARVLDIHPKKVPQAVNPAFQKIAKLLMANPLYTMRELLAAMEAHELELMQIEIDNRERMGELRLDRSVVHQR